MKEMYLSLVQYGWLGIILAALSEGIFLPLPMETISLPIYLINTEKALIYSLLLAAFSVMGSTVGYHIGKYFGYGILEKFIPKKNIDKLQKLYRENLFMTLITAAFSPIAYEAYVISAGTFRVDFKKFFLATVISRTIRHVPLGFFLWIFGNSVIEYVKKYFFFLSILIFSTIILKVIISKSTKLKKINN